MAARKPLEKMSVVGSWLLAQPSRKISGKKAVVAIGVAVLGMACLKAPNLRAILESNKKNQYMEKVDTTRGFLMAEFSGNGYGKVATRTAISLNLLKYTDEFDVWERDFRLAIAKMHPNALSKIKKNYELEKNMLKDALKSARREGNKEVVLEIEKAIETYEKDILQIIEEEFNKRKSRIVGSIKRKTTPSARANHQQELRAKTQLARNRGQGNLRRTKNRD
ncbi:MAG: hypothetical protein ABIH20_04940 [Candidatus Diapherotrites archaeon]